MPLNLLGLFERLINEHGSATVLKERLVLVKEQLVLHERKFAELEQENTQLRKQIQQLEEAASKDAAREQYTEYRGALFKRNGHGGHHLAVYCPKCQLSTAPWPTQGEPFACDCGWFSTFSGTELAGVVAEANNLG